MNIREQAHILGGRDIGRDENANDQAVDSNDTGHDNGNQGLNLLLVTGTGTGKAIFLAFMIKSGLKVPTPEIPMPDFAVPYAAPNAAIE